MALIPYRPLWDIDRWFDDDLTEWPMARLVRMPNMPRMNIYDENNNIVVEAEMPGMEPKDINAQIKDDVLIIEANKEKKEDGEGEGGWDEEESGTEAQMRGQRMQGQQQGQMKERGKEGQMESKKGRNYYKKEIRSEYIRRVIQLPDEVVAEKAEASFKNGMLRIVIPKATPKKEEEKIKKLEIK